MPLTLVTGPANSAKAGAVLGPLRDRLDENPILVVPAFEDVEHSQRELAQRGAVFGARVLRSGELFGVIAARAGLSARVASDLQRDLIVEEAVASAHLQVLAESAARPGFARAAVAFVEDLERSMIEPARFTQALRAWTRDGRRRRAYAEEIAELYRRYRAGLEAAGLMDRTLFHWRALDALRTAPASWGATPVFVYGFDDFTPVELDALEVLARHAGAQVTVSLPYEPGREAFRATATVREELAGLADRVEHQEPSADHYASGSRAALHALERNLFELGAGEEEPGRAVRLHAAGGERAEVELCGAEVLRLLRDGTPPGEVAVVLRGPAGYASTLEQIFGAYGIPYSIDRSLTLAHTSLGRGLLALLRCACLEGTPEDLLAYLRTPGLLTEPGLADRLEADVRRGGVATGVAARALWEETVPAFRLDAIDRLAGAEGICGLLDQLDRCLEGLFRAPYRRTAPVLAGAELDDARAFRCAHDAIAELRALAGAAALDRRRVHDVLGALRVRVGESPQPDRVQVASPEAIRARRFQAVLLCGLQEGEFPRGGAPDVFLPDADRRAIARASGLRLPMREERLERERYLFYVCASRAERELVLSCRYCDEEGNPQARSFFVDDVLAVFPSLRGKERRRTLAEVTWEPGEAPTPAEWERSVALRGPRRLPAPVDSVGSEAARAVLARRSAVSAGALEKYAGCPVRWLVEDVLRPARLEPDSEPMVRGQLAHRVLEVTFRRLREQTGERAISPGNLPRAEGIMRGAIREERGRYRVAATDSRVLATIRRLEHDLLATLRDEAAQGSRFEPQHLELRFGLEEDGHPAAEVAEGVSVRGVIDRVDVWGRYALVRDYKSGKVDGYKEASWARERRLQAPLYMLVVEKLLGLEAAGGVYTPLRGTDRRSRGLLAAELADQAGPGVHARDLRAPAEFAAGMERARGAIAAAAAGMRAGRLQSCPASCGYSGGCEHPSICRAEG